VGRWQRRTENVYGPISPHPELVDRIRRVRPLEPMRTLLNEISRSAARSQPGEEPEQAECRRRVARSLILSVFKAVPPLCTPSGIVPPLRIWSSEYWLSTKNTILECPRLVGVEMTQCGGNQTECVRISRPLPDRSSWAFEVKGHSQHVTTTISDSHGEAGVNLHT